MVGLFLVVATQYGLVLGIQIGAPHSTLVDCLTGQRVVLELLKAQTICVPLNGKHWGEHG